MPNGAGRKWERSSEALVEKFTKIFEGYEDIERKKMFGYAGCFLKGYMFTGLHEQNWILRLDDADREQMIDCHGAALFEPMEGRPMREYALEEILDLSEYLKLSNKEKDFSSFYHHARALFSLPEPWKLEKIEWTEFYASPHAEICLGMIAAHYEAAERTAFLERHSLRKDSLQDPIERIRTNTHRISREKSSEPIP